MTDDLHTVPKVIELDKVRELRNNLNLIKGLVRHELIGFTPHEFMALMYLLVHTRLSGVDRITIPLRYIFEGVVAADEDTILQVPVPFNKKTLLRALNGLEEKHWITIIRNRRSPGHGTTKAPSTFVMAGEKLERVISEYSNAASTPVSYGTAGIYPVVSDSIEPD